MKQLFNLLLLLLLSQCPCFAQQDNTNKNDSTEIIKTNQRYFSLGSNDRYAGNIRLPFGKVLFNDARYDTSFIALNWQANNNLVFKNITNRKYNLTGGLAVSLTNYVSQYFLNNFSVDDATLVCYIRKFAFALEDTSLKYFNPDKNLSEQKINTINFEVEGYYKTGNSMFPAFRIDTVYFYQLTKVRKDFTEAIKDVISPMIQRIINLDTGRIFKRKSYTQEQIIDRYQSRFRLPILTADSNRRGIYKSFEEFKNNAPSITSFNIQTKKIKVNAAAIRTYDVNSLFYSALERKNTTVFLYDANGELINPSSIFGFSDGTGCWIQHGAFYYPLIRVGNAFEFMYNYHYTDGNNHTLSTDILFSLNMENGHID